MLQLILAHGPILGVIAFDLGAVAFVSLLVAVAVWWLSSQPRLASPTGCVAPIIIGASAVMISEAAALVWLVTGWTVAGRVGGDTPEWHLLCLAVLPSVVAGAAYVWHRRARRR